MQGAVRRWIARGAIPLTVSVTSFAIFSETAAAI